MKYLFRLRPALCASVAMLAAALAAQAADTAPKRLPASTSPM